MEEWCRVSDGTYSCHFTIHLGVMRGLVPRIHVFLLGQDVDGRDKPGHDEEMDRPEQDVLLAAMMMAIVRLTVNPSGPCCSVRRQAT
jgi:hypothetical protein